MEGLSESAGWLFGWLLRNSAHAAILAGLVAGLELALGNRLGPRWRYGLWLMVLARLLVPIAPESRFSLFNLVDLAPPRVSGAALQVLELPAPVAGSIAETNPLADTPNWFLWALALWFPGATVLGVLIWRQHQHLQRSTAFDSPVEDESILRLLGQSQAVMGVRRQVSLVESDAVSTPAICGFWRPRLHLPRGLVPRLSTDELRFLFLHELAHVKRADLALNWLLAALQVLHWFNPVVWFAVRRLIAVREEVCDDLVLRCCFPGAARGYGLTLLRVLEECAPPGAVSPVPAFSGILDGLSTLRRRILWIRNFRPTETNSLGAASLTLAIALVGLTERPPDRAPSIDDARADAAARPRASLQANRAHVTQVASLPSSAASSRPPSTIRGLRIPPGQELPPPPASLLQPTLPPAPVAAPVPVQAVPTAVVTPTPRGTATPLVLVNRGAPPPLPQRAPVSLPPIGQRGDILRPLRQTQGTPGVATPLAVRTFPATVRGSSATTP